MATFITSKAVGESINIYVVTSTGFWKYNHDGSDSSVNADGWVNGLPVINVNGEFTIISCLSDGTVNGVLTVLDLNTNQLTSFDGTGLSSLTGLYLMSNLLTSFNGTGLSSLTGLGLSDNQLTSFDSTGLSSLTQLYLNNNLLTSFDSTGLSSLTSMDLSGNLLTSLDGTDLSNLMELYLQNNTLTSFDATGLSGLTYLYLNDNQLTPSSNNQILNQLNQNGLSGGEFISSNGRTSASNTDYDNLVSLGWILQGLDLIAVGNGKLRVKGVNSGGVPTQPWDGGTIYNIGAVVTHEGQTWNCIQYAPAGYGPFGGYIDVYWTL